MPEVMTRYEAIGYLSDQRRRLRHQFAARAQGALLSTLSCVIFLVMTLFHTGNIFMICGVVVSAMVTGALIMMMAFVNEKIDIVQNTIRAIHMDGDVKQVTFTSNNMM